MPWLSVFGSSIDGDVSNECPRRFLWAYCYMYFVELELSERHSKNCSQYPNVDHGNRSARNRYSH